MTVMLLLGTLIFFAEVSSVCGVPQFFEEVIDDSSSEVFTTGHRRALTVFLEQMAVFFQERARRDDPVLGDLARQIQHTLFRDDLSVVKHLNVFDRIVFASRVNRVAEIQETFGGAVVDDVVYVLSSPLEVSEGFFDLLSERISQLSLEERLDVVHQIQTIGARAAGIPESKIAYDRLGKVLSILDSESQSPFVSYAVSAAQDIFESQKNNPSFGGLSRFGSSSFARLRESVSSDEMEQHQYVSHRITSDVRLREGYRFSIVAPNIITIVDQGGVSQFFGSYDFSRENDGVDMEISLQELEQVRELFDTTVFSKFTTIVRFLYSRVPDFFERSSTFLIDDDRRYISSTTYLLDLKSQIAEIDSQIMESAGLQNEKVTEDFLEYFSEGVLSVLEEVTGSEKQMLQHAFDQYSTSIEQGDSHIDFEKQFDEARKFVLNLRFSSHFSKYRGVDSAVSSLIQKLDDLEKQHRENFSDAQNAISTSQERMDLMMASVEERKILDEMEDDLDFHERLSQFVESLREAVERERTSVHFSRYEEIVSDKNLNPLGDGGSALLLQHLHRPVLREKIEDDLGISLSEIPLHSQIHLLRFLAENDRFEVFDDVREAALTESLDQQAFFVSFLSCSESLEYGEYVLRIAQEFSVEQANEIFGKYSEIVDASEEIEGIVLEKFPDTSPEQIMNIKKSVLLRAQVLLRVAAEGVDGSSEERTRKYSVLLSRSLARALVLKEIFRQGKESGVINSLEDMGDVSMDKENGQDVLKDTQLHASLREMYAFANGEETNEMQEELLRQFDESLHAGAEVLLMRHGDQVVAMVFATPKGNSTVKIGVLCAHPAYAEMKIGNTVLQTILEEKYQDSRFEHVVADASFSRARAYITSKEYKAIGVGVTEYGGEPSVIVEFNKRQEYSSSLLKKREILALLEEEHSNDESIFVQFFPGLDYPPEDAFDGHAMTCVLSHALDGEKGNVAVFQKLFENGHEQSEAA